jgi:hypothetical protein
MSRRLLACVALVGLMVPVQGRAADSATPGIIVRIQSIDNLLETVHYLANLAGKSEEAKQGEAFIKSMAGEQGLKGIDMKRPIGIYGDIGAMGIDSTSVLLVPVADEKAFLALLENLNIKADKDADGVYSVNVDNPLVGQAYFRFANKYVYATIRDKEAIAPAKLLKPEQVLPADSTGVMSLALRIDKIPDNLKDLFLTQFELQINEQKDKKEADETPAQHAIKVKTIEYLGKAITSLVKDGGEVGLRFEVDRQKHDLVLELSLTGKANSKLATSITDLGQAKSLFGGLLAKNAAVNGILHVAVPDDLKDSIGAAFDEGFKEALAKEKDATKHAQLEKVLKVISPTLKAGELDAGVSMRGPSKDGHYTIVGGIKVKDGASIDKALREAIKDIPAKERDQIKLDAESQGNVKIHRVDAHKDFDAEAKRLFGENPIYVAIREDAALIGVGAEGLGALKEAISAAPKAAPPVLVEVSLAHLATAMAKDQKHAPAAAQKAFTEKDSDKITLTVSGGKALKVRFAMKSAVIKFIHLMEEGSKAAE